MGNEELERAYQMGINPLNPNESNSNENMSSNNKSEMIGDNPNNISNKEKDEEMENKIRNFLKCFICLTKVTKPRMCKFCKKICCESCINNWLSNHDYCFNCKQKVTSEEMITLPFLDDMSKYFVYNIDSHPKNDQEESNNNMMQKGSENLNEIKNEKEEKKMCPKHINNIIDYYCLQCREYFCSNCLVFFVNEGKKHTDHLILQLSKAEDLRMTEAVKEYEKLFETKKTLQTLIGMYKIKSNENEIKKHNITKYINNIKDQCINQIKENSQRLESILSNLEKKKKDIQNSLATISTTDDLKLEKFKKLNKMDSNYNSEIGEISEISPNIGIENYETDYLEFNLPFSGQFFDEFEIINQKIDIGPDNESRLIMKYLIDNVYISFCMDIELPLNAPKYPQFNAFIIFRKKNNGLETIVLSDKKVELQDIKKQQINSIAFDLEQFMNLAGEEKKIRFKLIILKYYFK